MTNFSVDAINKKLQQDEEWTRNFDAHVKRSAQLREGIEKLVGSFQDRLRLLEETVLPQHEVNAKLQVKQQNIQKLVKTIDATVQFYGRTAELEALVRDGRPALDLDGYLEHMESLDGAIRFFQTQSNYQMCLQKLTLESGFALLEKEFRRLVLVNSIQPEPVVVVDALDEQFELLPARRRTLIGLRNVDAIAKLSNWLFKRGSSTRFLNSYAEIRSEQLTKTLTAVYNQQHALHSHGGGLNVSATSTPTALPAQSAGKSGGFRNALKKAAGWTTEKNQEWRDVGGGSVAADAEAEISLVVFGSLLALLAVEEEVLLRFEITVLQLLAKVVPDVGERARTQRDLVGAPLAWAVNRVQRVVTDTDAGVLGLLPILKFLGNHETQLQTLANNSHVEVPFATVVQKLRTKCSTSLNEFVEKLRLESSKFVPSDGNVHPTTVNTLNFLAALAAQRQTVISQLLATTAPQGHPQSTLLPKLFARVLSALGANLRRKAECYEDPTLAALFLTNNHHHICRALEDSSLGLSQASSSAEGESVVSFYKQQVSENINAYMQCWNPVLNALTAGELTPAEDRQGMKAVIAVRRPVAMKLLFQGINRELETTVAQQREYCVADPALANEIRAKVKRMLVPAYGQLYSRCTTGGNVESSFAKYLRFTEESLEINIDRLFDSSA